MASSFTVKAKYQAQTRKFAFQGSYSFPTFPDLQRELSRVFPQLQTYSLQRLIFAPQPGKQILIGMAVHNEADYNSYIQAFNGGVYPGAILKVTIQDEAGRRVNNARQITSSTASTATHAQDLTVFRSGPRSSSSTTPVPHFVPRFIPPPPMPFPQQFSMGAIPPPPIIFSSPARHPQPMEVDSSTAVPIPPPPPIFVQPPHCCETEAKTQEVKNMLSNFLRDFDRLTTSTFGASTASLTSETGTVTPRSETPVEAPPQKPPKPWQTQSSVPRNNSSEHLAIPGSFASVGAVHVHAHDSRGSRRAQSSTPSGNVVVHPGIWCDSCKKTLVGVRHKCMKCRDYDLCTTCMEKPGVLDAHGPTHVFFDIPTPDTPVHRGVACDSCEKTIVGSRHKCLDCADFDICTPCMDRSRLTEMGHNPFHEFYELKEPGRIVVHNVLGNEGGRQPTLPRSTPASRERSETVTPAPAPPLTPPPPVVHAATCDLCDSRIIGDRYKCLACPDFDSCKDCFTITEEQHPGHGFVKVTDPTALVLRDPVRAGEPERHFAWCNLCKKTIHGVRYKCMHPACPDFDLCQDCEAHPIDMHPPSHPLLKMKTASTIIPTVYRVGGTTLISDTQQPVPIPSRLPTPQFEQPQVSTSVNVSNGVPTPFKQAEMTGTAYVPWYLSESPEIPQQPELVDTFPPVCAENGAPTLDTKSPAEVEQLMSELDAASNALSHLSTPVSLPPPTVPDAALDFGVDLTSQFSHLLRPTSSAKSENSLIDFDTKVDAQYSQPSFYSMFPQPMSMPKAPVEVVQPVPVAMPMPSPPAVEHPKTLSPLAQEPLLSTPFTSPLEIPTMENTTKVYEEVKAPSLHPMLQWLSTASASKIANDAPVSAPLAMPGAMPEELFTTNVVKPISPLTTPSAPSVPESSSSLVEPIVGVTTPPVIVLRGLQAPPTPAPLRASYEADLNIPDGQVFPPGAEFVKSWVLINDGGRCWPETAELRFVAGERMSTENTIVIGAVPAGSKATISTPEMKAPEAPGRYMSYWRLFEGKDGTSFGSSIWVDITVAEPSSEESSEGSLAASSVIMPHASGPSQPSISVAAQTVTSHGVASSVTASDDAVSIASSMSLVDAPSEDSDEEAWQETRSVPTPSRGDLEYVVLYESTSEDE